MNKQNHSFTDKVLKDKDGRIVIWQTPNLPLWGWLIFKILAMIFDSGKTGTNLTLFSKFFLFTWAFLELTQGVNYFRRGLGLVVLVMLAASQINS
jgi:hypothetical protein